MPYDPQKLERKKREVAQQIANSPSPGNADEPEEQTFGQIDPIEEGVRGAIGAASPLEMGLDVSRRAAGLGAAFGAGMAGADRESGFFNPQNIAEEAGRIAPPAIGAGFAGPAGAAAAASTQNLLQQSIAQVNPDVPEVSRAKILTDPVAAAAFQSAAEKFMTPEAMKNIVKGLSRFVQWSTGVKERVAKRAISDPTIFTKAKGSKAAGEAMESFAAKEGFDVGSKARRGVTGSRFVQQDRAIKVIDNALDRLESGVFDAQELIVARQMATNEIARPKFGNPLQAGAKRELAEAMEQLDAVIEKFLPGWGKVVKRFADEKAVEDFGKILPLNQNLSPSQIRMMANTLQFGLGIGSSAATGSLWPVAISALMAAVQSPFVVSLPLRAAGAAMTAAGQVPAQVTKAALSAPLQAAGAEASQFLEKNIRGNRRNTSP